MSLSLASQTISRMLRARVHRHREGQVLFWLLTLAHSFLISDCHLWKHCVLAHIWTWNGMWCIVVWQIVKHINRHNNLEARVDRVDERSRQVCITDDTICGHCHARIGTKLFVLYPDDSIVCYKVLWPPIQFCKACYPGESSKSINWHVHSVLFHLDHVMYLQTN